jgi:hypothetical protein
MAWTYTGNPSSSAESGIRFEIGDTDSLDPLLTDEEITYAISQEASIDGIKARCFEAIAAKFAREADKGIGQTRVSASQRSDHYEALAKKFRQRASGHAIPVAGGITIESVVDIGSIYLQPIFSKNMHDRS